MITINQMWNFCMLHANKIYVRDKDSNGRWCTMLLADLDPQRQKTHVQRWFTEQSYPVRIKAQNE